MATRKPATKRPTTTTTTDTPAPRRRTGAVRRTKAAAPALAAAPEVELAGRATETPVEEHIRVRAYYLHLERRGRPADPVADWLRARQEVLGGADA